MIKKPKTEDQRSKPKKRILKQRLNKTGGVLVNIKFFIFCFVFSVVSLLSVVCCLNAYAQEGGIIPVIKFKDADIRVVLQSIAQKAVRDGRKVNIVPTPNVEGFVSVSLENVDWQTALEVILKAYDYGYDWVGENIILVEDLEILAEKRKKETETREQEPLMTETYKLKFLDANDVKKFIEYQLTPRGKVTVLGVEPQKGWKKREVQGFTPAEREGDAKERTRTLIITDAQSNIAKILKAIEEIDVIPKQVLIEAKIMEVNKDWLKDIGFDWGTGQSGASASALSFLDVSNDAGEIRKQAAGHMLTDQITPSVFGSKSSKSMTSSNTGLKMAFKKLGGAEFEAIMYALEEDVHTNTLSSPRIVTLDGQEAYIMVGEKRPIILSQLSSKDNVVIINKALKGYLDLGIQLNVVPQICEDNYINMALYPAVTSSSQDVTATSQIGADTSTDSYPIILVRETQTQILMKDGETIAIGGLLKDVKSKGIVKVPILGDIPFLGSLFRRETEDIEKIELLIFVTAKILRQGEAVSKQILDTARILSEFEDMKGK